MPKILIPYLFVLRALWAWTRGRALTVKSPTGHPIYVYREGVAIPAIAGGDGEEDEVDEDELPDPVKAVLAKERKARREAERAQRDAERAASEARDQAERDRQGLQTQIDQLQEAAQNGGGGGEGGDAEAQRELQRQATQITELEGQLAEANQRVVNGQDELRRARLTAELRNPDYEIASDMVDLAVGALDVEYDDAGQPQGVGDAVTALLEQRPSLRRQEAPPPSTTSPANPQSRRDRGPTMTKEEATRLARDDPDRFNEMYDKGEIPSSALGG